MGISVELMQILGDLQQVCMQAMLSINACKQQMHSSKTNDITRVYTGNSA